MAEGNDEPTVECPNCGALGPGGAPRCFICEEPMPEPSKKEVKPPELAPEELPPVEKVKIESPQPVQEKVETPPAEPVVEKPPEEVRAPVEEVIEAAPAKPSAADEKAEKLKAAYEAGRIPKEVYVGNLRALGIAISPELGEPSADVETTPEIQPVIAVEIPPVVEEAKEKPPEEVRLPVEEVIDVAPPKQTAAEEKTAKLKAAFEAGRIPEDLYVENLKGLGVAVPAELEAQPAEEEIPPAVQPEVIIEVPIVKEEVAPPRIGEKPPDEVAPPVKEKEAVAPPKASAAERKGARLRKAYETGKITKGMYEDSLKTLDASAQKETKAPPSIALEFPTETPPAKAETSPPKVEEKPRVEIPSTKEPKATSAKQSVAERKAARLKKAYETGKITKGMYEDSVKKLSAVAPPEHEPAPAKEAAPKTRSVVEEVAQPPPEETPPEKVIPPLEIKEVPPAVPSEDEVRAAKLKSAYESGLITKDVYIGNLMTLGLPIPPELERQEEAPGWTPAAEAVPEVVPPVEEEAEAEAPQVEEIPAEVVEEAPAIAEAVSKGELEEARRSHRGVAIASAGGLVYVLVWFLFIPMLGNFLSFVFTALGAVLIVVGYNIASNDAAAAKRARTFRCPLCTERLEVSVSECPNCGAKFND